MSDSPSFDPDHTARFVSERTGGFYRGSGEILPGGDFSPAELEKLKAIKTWDLVCKWLRARTYNSRERLDAYIKNNPQRVKAKKIRRDRKIREQDYLTNEFVAVDFEGQDYLNNVIHRENGSDNKHASHPISAMINYCIVIEAGRLARALAGLGLALQIGFLHGDKHGRNSLVWDAIEPLRAKINARVFAFISSHKFARSDFPASGVSAHRIAQPIIAKLLARCLSPNQDILDCAAWLRDLVIRFGVTPRQVQGDLSKRGARYGRLSIGVGDIREPGVPSTAASSLAARN